MCESKEYRIPRLQEAYLDDEGRGAAYSDRQMNETFERQATRRQETKRQATRRSEQKKEENR